MKSFKTELDLNNWQKTQCAKHAGTARHAWNWGLALCQDLYAQGQKRPTAFDLHKRLVAEVKRQHEWYYEVSKCAPQEALRQLDRAFKHSFTVKNRKLPKFKKKGIKDSFYLEGSIKIQGNRIKLPRLGWVKSHEELPQVQPKNVTISKRAGRWFIAFKIDVMQAPQDLSNLPIVGVDVGLKTLATLSTGRGFDSPKAYKANTRRLKRLQRKLSRQIKGSRNRERTKLKLAAQHKRVADIRLDATHKLTTYLAKNHSKVVIEDLNVSGMLKNHKLAGAIADGGFYEFRRQLTYKCEWYGSELVVIDRFYPSSQLCSTCGERQPMPLKLRQYNCSNCGLSLDRDLNAAINLAKAASSAVPVCEDSKVHDVGQVRVAEAETRQQSLTLSKF